MADIKCLRIAKWDEHFENNRTREMKSMAWVPFPNKLDGDGYTELVEHKDGASHYAAWTTLVMIASRCDPRGTLLRAGARPHDSTSLARITRLSQKLFQEAIPRLIDVGWLETIVVAGPDVTTIPQEGAVKPQEGAEIPQAPAWKERKNGTEGMEGNKLPQELDTEAFKEAWHRWERHRREKHQKLTPSTLAAQIKQLASVGTVRAIAMIENSIGNGYTGLFEPNQSGTKTNVNRTIHRCT